MRFSLPFGHGFRIAGSRSMNRQCDLAARSRPSSPAPDAVLMVLLTLLAMMIRVYGLSSSYSCDELTVSMSMAEKPLPQLLMRAEPWRLVPALCAFVLYKVFGICEICGRTLSFVSGTLSVPLLYLLAAPMDGDPLRICHRRRACWFNIPYLVLTNVDIVRTSAVFHPLVDAYPRTVPAGRSTGALVFVGRECHDAYAGSLPVGTLFALG